MKLTALTIKKMHEIEWRPMHLIGDLSISIGAVMRPAGLDASEGILSAT
jgi:branched-chain amino acid transport system substrate-binding protein